MFSHPCCPLIINSNVIFDKAKMMEGEDSLFIIYDDDVFAMYIYFFLSNRISINFV